MEPPSQNGGEYMTDTPGASITCWDTANDMRQTVNAVRNLKGYITKARSARLTLRAFSQRLRKEPSMATIVPALSTPAKAAS